MESMGSTFISILILFINIDSYRYLLFHTKRLEALLTLLNHFVTFLKMSLQNFLAHTVINEICKIRLEKNPWLPYYLPRLKLFLRTRS